MHKFKPMKRRQFIKTLTAAAATPLMPAHMARANTVTGAQYAKAVEAAHQWAYLSVGNLKRALGVTSQTSQALLTRLHADGIIGAAGQGGITLAPKYVVENARIAAKTLTAQKVEMGRTSLKDIADKMAQKLPEPTDEGDAPKTTDQPAPTPDPA